MWESRTYLHPPVDFLLSICIFNPDVSVLGADTGNHAPCNRHRMRCSLTNCRASVFSSSLTCPYVVKELDQCFNSIQTEKGYRLQMIAPCALIGVLQDLHLEVSQTQIFEKRKLFLHLLDFFCSWGLSNNMVDQHPQ